MEQSFLTNEVLIGSEYPPKFIKAVELATTSIVILMFDWRFYPYEPASAVQKLNMALSRASQRGVKVRCLVNSGDIVLKLREIGIDAKKFNSRDLLHSKLAVIDDAVFFLGSHNFTKNAFSYNFETSLCSFDPASSKKLKDYFENLWQL